MQPSDYSLFLDSIQPKWEDLSNKNGGCWIVEFFHSDIFDLMQNIWETLLESIVNKHCYCEHYRHISGIKISIRYNLYVISLWIDSNNRYVVFIIILV